MNTKKRDLLGEIKAVRRRQSHPNFVFSATMERLQKLHLLSNTEFGNSEEFARYIPKAVVAALQGFLRSVFGSMVDLGEPYSSRIAKYLKDKSRVTFDFVTVREIAEKNLTLGEFVAHCLSLNNFEDVIEWFSAILEAKFIEELKKQTHQDGNLIIENQAIFFEQINALFRERHIFSHELANHYSVS